MKYTQIWVAPGLDSGVHPIGLEPVRNEWHRPVSVALFCPITGEIWARRIVLDETDTPTRWMMYAVASPGQPNPSSVWMPGALTSWIYTTSELTSVPKEVLIRDFLAYCDWANSTGQLDILD